MTNALLQKLYEAMMLHTYCILAMNKRAKRAICIILYTKAGMIKIMNQGAIFLLEITMLVSYGYYGITRQWGLGAKLLFTVFILSIAIALWSIFAAPKSGHRLEMPYLAIFRGGMFFIAAFFLFQTGYKNIALLLVVLAIITQVVSLFTER